MPRKSTHGMSGTRIYLIWLDMRKRCYVEKTKAFKYYGGRGITVCDEWRSGFEKFYLWALDNGYAENLTIDRFPDKNGNYEPSNCRWVTQVEQLRNRSCTRFVNYRGERHTATDLAREFGLHPDTFWQRLKLNWDVERALTTVPIRTREY